MTKVLSNSSAEAVGECYTTTYNLYSYLTIRAAQFPDFVGVLTAFLQNLIGNILNFNTLYTNIVNANNAGKMSDVYFFMGRLTYLIVYFDPIIEASLFNSPTPSFEALDKYFLGQSKKNSEPATVMTIIFDLPSSIAISSKNSSICLGNLTQFNQSVSLLSTQFQLSLYDKMGATLRRIM